MFKLFSLVILVLSSAESLRQLDGRIVGGEPVLINEYPFQVSLQAKGRHRCGGSIITKNHVVTAAHCVAGVNPNILTIRAGSSYHAKEGIVIEVEKFYEHPKYNDELDYDIAVVKLKENFEFNATIQPTALFDLNEIVPEGIESTAIGWGVLKENNMVLPAQLQAVKVPIVSLTACRKAYGFFVNERMICAGYPEGGKDACQGDSGGPLIVNDKLVGITSWGNGCARPRYPGVYASVPNLRSFIDGVIGL